MEQVEQSLVPHVVTDQSLVTLAPTAMVAEAVSAMVGRHIAAVLVCDDAGRLRGIFSERDAVARVLAAGRDPATTPLSAVMTPDPDTVGPDSTPREALQLMHSRGYRHLPIVADGQVAGIVSVRDLFAVVTDQLERAVSERDAFIYGFPG